MNPCEDCGAPFVKRGNAHRFCEDCRKRRIYESHQRWARANPEKERARKRRYERTKYRTTCADCGKDIRKTNTRCWDCDIAQRGESRLIRWAVIKALWDSGMSMNEMVTFPEVCRANRNALGVELDRMKKAGVDLPYRRPGWTGEYDFVGPPRKPTIDHKLVAQRLEYAVRKGDVTRPDACERCGVKAYVHGHHDDYSKPLEVEWLCPSCHSRLHWEERRAAA